MHIIVKNYEHYNKAMGKYITSKKHYEQEMVRGGYIPFEKAQQLAESAKQRETKKYDGLSEKTMRFLHQVKDMADKKGNIKAGSRFVEGLKEQGVKLDCQYDKLPKSYQGGFDG